MASGGSTRVRPIPTEHGPMWDARIIVRYLNTRCSATTPDSPRGNGGGLLPDLFRLLAHHGLYESAEVMRRDADLYLGPRAAHILVDQIVADKGSSPRAKSLQAQFLKHTVADEPATATPEPVRIPNVDNVSHVVLPTGTVPYTVFDGERWVSLPDLATGLGDASLTDYPAPSDIRTLSFDGQALVWTNSTGVDRVLRAAEDTLERDILMDIFEETVSPAPAPAVVLAPEPEPAADAPTPADDDDVKLLSVPAYVQTVCADPAAQRVFHAIIKNDGITRAEIRNKMTSKVKRGLDGTLEALQRKNAVYCKGSAFHAVLEYNGVRVAI